MIKRIKWCFGFVCLALLGACNSFVQVQDRSLYNEVAIVDSNEIDGFKAVYIFNNDYDKSVWASPEVQCVQMATEKVNVFSGPAGLKVTWDKIAGNCKWIGIGFGWNNWMSKDISDLKDNSAIQMKVKSVKGSFKNFPVAFALEDYSGVQAYYGFNYSLASGEFTDSAWTTVLIPLSKFPFEAKDFDLERVKQFIIQLEGDGNIYLDEIKFIKLEDEKTIRS